METSENNVVETDVELPYITGTPAEQLNWNYIADPQARNRIYLYPGGETLAIPNVEWVAVKINSNGTHTHRLRTSEGRCVYVPPGWRAIEWAGYFQF